QCPELGAVAAPRGCCCSSATSVKLELQHACWAVVAPSFSMLPFVHLCCCCCLTDDQEKSFAVVSFPSLRDYRSGAGLREKCFAAWCYCWYQEHQLSCSSEIVCPFAA